MSLHRRGSLRKFPPSAMWKPLRIIFEEHYKSVQNCLSEDDWAKDYQPIWKSICADLRKQEEGKVLGTYKAIKSIRFHEELAINDDAAFRLAAGMISQPIVEDLINQVGLHDLIEDFFLVKYRIAANLSRRGSSRVVSVRFPPIYYRILTGYPSPKRIKREFMKAVAGLWTFEFVCDCTKDCLYFQVGLPKADGTECCSETVDIGLDLLKVASLGV